MREINVPGRGIYRIEYLVLDLNGTLSIDGTLIDGVAGKLLTLGRFLDIRILTADTLGKADAIASSLKFPMMKIKPESQQTQKLQYIQRLGSEATAAIGNGANDALMVKAAALGICVLGLEGAASETLINNLVAVPGINAARPDLLLKPERLIATLRL